MFVYAHGRHRLPSPCKPHDAKLHSHLTLIIKSYNKTYPDDIRHIYQFSYTICDPIIEQSAHEV